MIVLFWKGAKMITKQILGKNRFGPFSEVRSASRAIIIKNDEILLVHALKNDVYMLPGGGLESGETMEQCCIREVEEETGFICKIIGSPVRLEEYYNEYKFIDQYFICEITGEGEKQLTPNEINSNVVAEWMNIEKCMVMFSHHNDFIDYEEKRGVYLREFTALCEAIYPQR